MAVLDLQKKLAILFDAAKYDASCASSGGTKRDSLGGKGVGSVDGGMGICHTYAPAYANARRRCPPASRRPR